MKHINTDGISCHDTVTECGIIHQIVQKCIFYFLFIFYFYLKPFANLAFIPWWILHTSKCIYVSLPLQKEFLP